MFDSMFISKIGVWSNIVINITLNVVELRSQYILSMKCSGGKY